MKALHANDRVHAGSSKLQAWRHALGRLVDLVVLRSGHIALDTTVDAKTCD